MRVLKLENVDSIPTYKGRYYAPTQKRNISIYIFNDRNGKLLLLVNHWLCLNSSHNFKQYYRRSNLRRMTLQYLFIQGVPISLVLVFDCLANWLSKTC